MKVNIGPFPDSGERKVEIELHEYDTFDADHTIALIVAPMLHQFRDQGVGGFCSDTADVPDGVGEPDATHDPGRSAWIVDEMIWTFDLLATGEVLYDDAINERINNGLRLFGKYFRALWN